MPPVVTVGVSSSIEIAVSLELPDAFEDEEVEENVEEIAQLKSELEEYRNAVKYMRGKLNEVNLGLKEHEFDEQTKYEYRSEDYKECCEVQWYEQERVRVSKRTTIGNAIINTYIIQCELRM